MLTNNETDRVFCMSLAAELKLMESLGETEALWVLSHGAQLPIDRFFCISNTTIIKIRNLWRSRKKVLAFFGICVIIKQIHLHQKEIAMNFSELAKARYSVRKFKNAPIEDEKLAAIIEAGRVAPTACNYQPQKIFVVKNEEMRKKIASVCDYTFGAPVLVIVAYDKERAWKNPLMENYHSGETDAAIVCTHMMLAAWEQGIGSCWVGYFNAKDVETVLGLPDHLSVTAMLPLGYPADGAKPSRLHSACRECEDTVTVLD